jgi:PAS domain S-box-containing protein
MGAVLTGTEYRLLVEHSPVMIWRAGLDAKCDYFNEPWLSFTGRTLAQELGDGWAEGVHAEDLKRCVDHYMDHFQRREAFEMEYRLRRHDGEFRWIFDRGVPFTDDAGEFAGFIGSCVDVHERRLAQLAREKESRQQLALAREFEQWVLAIVGHDIRNPLGAIDGSAKLLALRAGRDEQMRDIADRIARSAARITAIVGDLLDLSRERHGGIPVVLAPTDLHTLCCEVAAEIATFTTDRKISVACESGTVTGMWDSARLTQALSNLVGNAVKHGTPGRPIDVRIRVDNGNAIAEVHNEGAIHDDLLPTLFKPFASRSGRQGRHDGLGLGLFIAQSIARAHHGDLQVHTSAEDGTTFRLVLPRAG